MRQKIEQTVCEIMPNDVTLFCENLKSTFGSLDTKRASIYLDAIDQYFNDRVSEDDIDLAVERVFREDGGVLGFLKLCLGQFKIFKNETVKSLDLLFKVIELYPDKVIPYATNTIIICLQYIRSTQISARQGERSVAVIEKLVLMKCCDSVDRRFLMDELLKIIQQMKPGNVQSRMFELIGCFARDHPDCIDNENGDGIKIRDIFFQVMEKTVVGQQDISMISLCGAFNGLNDFLVNFGPSEEHKEDFVKRAYTCIKPFAVPLDISQKNVQKNVHKSAMKLLASRCDLFRKEIFDDFYWWHDLLVEKWLKMNQFENRRTAIYLMSAIHREIAKYILESSDIDRCRKILTFLHTFFKKIVESTTSQPSEIRLAVVGFGDLAAPSKKLMSTKYLDELFNLVIQRTKCVARDVNHSNKEQLEHFPDYVEALSKIMEHVQLSTVHLPLIEDILVSLIRNFHLLSSVLHTVTINTLMRTFNNLLELGESILDDVLKKVIYQGVIWTCSHKLLFDVSNDWDKDANWKDYVTYRSYLPLWNGFLVPLESTIYNRTLITKIYDQLISTLFRILDKLDLSLQKRVYNDDSGNDQELFFSDPNYDLEPVRPKDFHIFFNVVNFYCALFETYGNNERNKNNFLQWLNQLIDTIIGKSLLHPLVSGFIRLMETILQISDRFIYFDNNLQSSSTVFKSVHYYLKLIMDKVEQSHDEFRIACLKLLFSAPACMICTLVNDMIPIFQIALEIGKSQKSLFIANMALNAIEKYLHSVDQASNESEKMLRAVLPYFDAYLRGFKNDTIQTLGRSSRRKQKNSNKSAEKLIKLHENDLLKFQKRIIFFLGTLEPEHCLYLVQDSENNDLVKWDATKIIRLTVNGTNFNPKICIDSLLPRIREIAVSSTDRQKKVTACEIIHATILYLVGSYNHRGKLWREMCSLMFQLACDDDESIQQMFEPLVMQTIHYMSKSDQLNQPGTEILLKCIMDAISCPSRVRDLAARSLREFLLWTFRHSKPEQLAASPFNIDTIVHQLKLFSSDTLNQRRFGAALAFNNIYRVLREEESIIDKYFIDLMYDFAISFKFSEHQRYEDITNKSIDLTQVSATMDHISRVLCERKDIFNSPNPNRIKPDIFPQPMLRDAVLWLFSQCNSLEPFYRNKTMEMFLALSRCIDGYNSSADFLRDTQTLESVIQFCDNGIEPQIEFTSCKVVSNWLRHLLTALDCFIWFIENNFVLEWEPVFENTQIFKALEYYFKNIMNENIFRENHSLDNLSKTSAMLIQIFKFLNKVMALDCVTDAVWESNELIWAIETSIFHPQFLECDTINKEFLFATQIFIKNINRFGSSTFKESLNQKLIGTMTDTYQSLASSIKNVHFRCSIPTSDSNKLIGVDFVCRLLKKKTIYGNVDLFEKIHVLCKNVLYGTFEGIVEKQSNILMAKTVSPDALKFSGKLLQVCLNNSTGIHINLIDLLLNKTDLVFGDSSKPIKHGQHFLNLYYYWIHSYFVNNVDIIVKHLISKMISPNIIFVLRILIEILNEAHQTVKQNNNRTKILTNIVLNNWSNILERTNLHRDHVITMALIELVEQIVMICPFDLTEIVTTAQGIEKWLLDIIIDEKDDAEIKIQAIRLLPCLIGPGTYEHPVVTNNLEELQKVYFPLATSELKPGSVERATYENLFQSLLQTMNISKSPILLKFVINCSAPDQKHILNNRIIEEVRMFMRLIETKHQLYCLNYVFELFASRSHDPAIRTVLMKRFLLEMIPNSAKDVVVEFYAMHIRTIEQLLETPYGLDMPEFKLNQAFTSRIGAFEMLETLIALLTREEICQRTCPIVIAKFGKNIQKGNELLAWMSHKAVNTKMESFQTDNTQYMEWFRKYQCASFKALCAIICNTQTQLKFYEKWIFDERHFVNMINVTDPNLYMNQTLDVDKKPQIKERMLSIRRLKKTEHSTINSKYFESETVFESSLSQDVAKVDMTAAYVRTCEEVKQMDRLANYQSKSLIITKNSINDHEVMATICGVIDHMFENNITPINDDGSVRRQKLGWVENVCNAIGNKNIHINVRMFLAAMIDNSQHWFRSYSDVVSVAVLKFLKDVITINNSINALAIFLMVDLLEWDSTYKLNTVDEQQLASDFIQKFIELSLMNFNRRNLEIIQLFVQNWRTFISLPHKLLCERISDTNNDSKQNISGIQLNGIVLTNGLVPWNETTKNEFLQAIFNCLDNIHADVFQPAAQVLGMTLHTIIVRENNGRIGEYEFFIGRIRTRLKELKRSNEKKFMYILYYMDKHYVIDGFLTTILNLISSSISDVKKLYLQMFLARVNHAEPRDIDLILIDLLNQSQEEQHQLIGLHIFNKALSILSLIQIKNLLPRVAIFQNAVQTDTRSLVYEIMKYVRDNHSSDEEVKKIATTVLISALNDVDTSLQSSAFKYWTQTLETSLNHRILYILRHLYSADFLKYGIQLMIDLNSADSKQKLLRDRVSDDDSKYTEYDINTQCKFNSNFNIPMFTESTKRHLGDGFGSTNINLRSTHNTLQFDPTLDPTSVHAEINSFSLHSTNSLQFQIPQRLLDRRSQYLQSENPRIQTNFVNLREHILRQSNTGARQQALEAGINHNNRQLQLQQKAGSVKLYRRYRFGDFPDFFINSLAFLMPLQMLVKTDVILAKITFTSLINSVIFELNTIQRDEFLSELTTILKNIVYDPMLFSAVADVAYTNSMPLHIASGCGMVPSNINNMLINNILMLENRIIHGIDIDEDAWIELAELYYILCEHDLAAAIFATKINSDPMLAEAIQYESNCDYLKALKLYIEFVGKSSNAETILYNKYANSYQFSCNSIFNCFEVMGRWEDLERSVLEQLTDDESGTINFEQLFANGWNTKHLLPHYIRSETRTLIYAETCATSKFLTNIQNWLRCPERVQLIKRHYSEQLMVIHIANKDYLQAKVCANQCLDVFLDEWSKMSHLSGKMRRELLMNTRRIAEMYEYADLLQSTHITDVIIAKLCGRWNRTIINRTDRTAMWESLISYRIFITEHALEKFNSKQHPIVERIKESMFEMQFKLNDLALQQKNLELSNSMLGRLNSFRREYGNGSIRNMLKYELATLECDRIKCMKENGFDDFIRTWTKFHQFHTKHEIELKTNLDIYVKLFESFNNMMKDLSQEIVSKFETFEPALKQTIFELTIGHSQNAAERIGQFATHCCSKTIELLEKYESSNIYEKSHEIGDSYHRLALFCLQHYSSGLIINGLNEIGKLLIKSILRGMRHGSKSARLQFPRILEIPNINEEELDAVFNDEVNRVPLWTFISSITQIMSRFDFRQTGFMDTLLLQLSKTYPTIVVYAIQPVYNNFCIQYPKQSIRPLLQQIFLNIANPLIEKYINGLKCLSLPEKVLQHHLYCITDKSKDIDRHLEECFKNVFENQMRGKAVEKVLALQNEMCEILTNDRSNHREFINSIKQVLEKLKRLVTAKQKSSERLSMFCPWLSKYHWHGSDNFIELPGQYNGYSVPNADNCIKIVKFNEHISILHSLRKPIKLSAVCSDGKTYSFLVKYGEDLRQDERIQHVQDIMCDQMQLDKSCNQHNLLIRTYKVIPLNPYLGTISWIPYTDSVQSFLSSNEPKWNKINSDIRDSYDLFIMRHQEDNRRNISPNVAAVLKYTPEEIADNLKKLQRLLPKDVLRKALYKLSASPECFFVLRNNFGKSLATMSIVHWILGIGDRNLGNFLIDKTNGTLIGIDFNLAFGAATRNLHIPELVPFRLTSQFINTLEPLGCDAFLAKLMCHTLHIFSIEIESIMAALEVFIRQPTTEYLRNNSSETESLDSSEKARTPEQSLNTIRDKLNGINPIIPIENDINKFFYSYEADVVFAYTNLINGSTNQHKNKKRKFTAEEQVKTLIGIATNSSVLGVAYKGFQPWC